ncbi:MAG: hypothetical protein ABH967_01785, partial [Patescibacteria group bacterium]
MNNPKEKTYISLAEAAEDCKYSQEYLSLRARQGKLKAVKFGRNWVTKKEWLEEYLNVNEKKKINDKPTTTLAPENLPIETSFASFDSNVQAKQFNFEEKFVRLANVSDLKIGIVLHRVKKTMKPALVMRFGFLIAFTISLVVTNLVFGQESFGLAYQDTMSVLDKISKSYDAKVVDITSQLSDEAYDLSTSALNLLASSLNTAKSFVAQINESTEGQAIKETMQSSGVTNKTYEAIVILEDVGSDFNGFVKNIVRKYNNADSWLEKRIVQSLEMISGKAKSYLVKFNKGYEEVDNYFSKDVAQKTNVVNTKISETKTILGKEGQTAFDEISQPAKSIGSVLAQEYKEGKFVVNSLINGIIETIKGVSNSFVNVGKFLIKPWGFVPAEVASGIDSKDIEEIRNEIQELREKGIVSKEIVKEVSKITQVQPVKEITKEVVRVDNAKLMALEEEISSWRGDIEELKNITTKLQSHPTYTPVSNAPIYIASQGIEVGGEGTFTGIGVSGMISTNDFSVGGTTVLGSDYGDSLTVNATAYFQSVMKLNAPLILSTNSITPALSITQAGTGDIISMSRTGGGSFVIDENGFIVGTGTLRINEPGGETWEMGVTTGSLTYSGELTLASGGTGDIVLDPASGIIQANTGDTFYTEGGNPIRETGEELFKKAVSIFKYSMPSQTSSTTFIRISKHFDTTADISLPAALTGTTRKYRLVINCSDDIDPADGDADNTHSDWRIVNTAGDTVADSFELAGLNDSSFEESQPYLTEQITIPDA